MAVTITSRALTERQRRFALAYMRLANGTKAAIEAGYSEKSAHVQGSLLIRNSKVLDFIDQNRIKRDIHSDVTYQNQIALTDVALKLVREVMNDPAADLRDKVLACENARRCSETLARIEGLMTEAPKKADDAAAVTLQLLAQRLRQPAPIMGRDIPRIEQAVKLVEAREVTIQIEESPADAPRVDGPPADGNGHAEGNGHAA